VGVRDSRWLVAWQLVIRHWFGVVVAVGGGVARVGTAPVYYVAAAVAVVQWELVRVVAVAAALKYFRAPQSPDEYHPLVDSVYRPPLCVLHRLDGHAAFVPSFRGWIFAPLRFPSSIPCCYPSKIPSS